MDARSTPLPPRRLALTAGALPAEGALPERYPYGRSSARFEMLALTFYHETVNSRQPSGAEMLVQLLIMQCFIGKCPDVVCVVENPDSD